MIVLSMNFSYAVEENNKPLFVTVTAKSCFTCQQLKPVIEELEYEYNMKVEFVTLDVSSKTSLEEAQRKATELGIIDFFNKDKNLLPKVVILCPNSKKISKTFIAEIEKNLYSKALDKLLLGENKICSL